MMLFSALEIKKLELLMGTRPHYSELEKKYFHKAQKYFSYFKYIPGVKLLAIGNSVAMKSSHNDSDIDVFVIAQKNRLWIVRISLTFFLFLLRKRKTSTKHADSFCLSFFVDTDSLDFSNIAIKNDIYLFYWILTLKPIIDYDDTFQKFLNANRWANFEEFSEYNNLSRNFLDCKKETKNRKNIFLDSFNNILKRVFLPRTINSYKKLGKPFGVIINEGMLKFHNNDKRKYFSEKIFEGNSGKNLKNT